MSLSPEQRATLEEAERTAQEIGRTVKKMMLPGWAFFLCMASIGNEGVSTYVSSIQRPEAIKLLKEMIEQLEKKGFSFDV